MKIPFVDLSAQYESIRPEIDATIAAVLAQTAFIGGPFVDAFEAGFGAAYGVKHVVGCGNGTDSLYIVMKMLGIGAGHEVITAANSWISSSETITQAGARPVFVDVHPDYFSMDEEQVEAKISPSTRAIIAVHLQGQMCAIDRLKIICDKHGLFLIEDCAQAHFSDLHGKRAGLTGIAGSFSFYPGKNLGAYGDAGCIITDDDVLADRCRMYSHHGALKKHAHKMEGINSRLDGLQAAVLSAKLPHLAGWIDRRIRNAALYHKYLGDIGSVRVPAVRPGSRHTWHLYVIRAERRDQLSRYLHEAGIETTIHYPRALPNLEVYRYLDPAPDAFPVATRHEKEILSLPMYPELDEQMIEYVCRNIRSFYGRA